MLVTCCKKHQCIITLFVLALVLFFGGYFVATKNPARAEPAEPRNLSPTSSIRSVTFYDFPATNEQRLQHLAEALTQIRATGFSTIWLVSPWAAYNPKPLSDPPVYNDQEFEILRETLNLLRENGMQAILGLNYLGSGWAPDGIDACNWIRDQTMYTAFETYVQEFLNRIVDYRDMVYILFFTEGAEPCNLNPYGDAEEIASLLQPTLGSLPKRLPANLRSQFRIGYHDYTLINLNWAHGKSPIQDPVSFDFVSMVAYGLDRKSDEEIRVEIDARASRFKNLYPNTPLIIGEFGARGCENGEDEQARVIETIVSHALDYNYGFNLWGWKPGPSDQECTNPVFGGLAITNQDGTPRKSVETLKEVLRPQIENSGINMDYELWAVWLTGKNFNPFLIARLSDGSVRWGGDISTILATDFTWLSFLLPSSAPPSGCNFDQPCSVSLELIDQRSGLSSSQYSLTLPQREVTPTPTVGDANKDGRVDSEDFALLLEDYLKEPVHDTDFNSDGRVDSEDFAILQANYLK